MPLDLHAETLAVHLKRAQDALNANNYREAEREAIAALSVGYRNASVLLLLSQTSDRQKLWDAAEATAIEAVAAAPNNAFAHYRVGWCRVQCNRPATAVDSLKRAAELHPSWGRYHTMYGYAMSEAMVEPAKQREMAMKGVATTATDEWTHSVGAQILNLLGEPTLAETWARKALSMNKAEGHLLAIACAERLQGKLREALASAEKVVGEYPAGSGGWAELAEVQASFGWADQAIVSATKSIERTDRSWEAHHALVRAHLVDGDREEALKAARRAIALNNEHPRVLALESVVTAGVLLWPCRPIIGS